MEICLEALKTGNEELIRVLSTIQEKLARIENRLDDIVTRMARFEVRLGEQGACITANEAQIQTHSTKLAQITNTGN